MSRQFDITVLAPSPPSDCSLLEQVHAWHELPGVGQSFRQRLLQSPFVIIRRPSWRRQIHALCQTLRPDIVWFSYGHWGHYASLADAVGARTIMRTHNAQSRLTLQGLSSRPLTRWHVYYAARYPLEVWHERRLFRRFDRVLSVTEADQHYHARRMDPARSLCVPNFVDERCYQLARPVTRDQNLVLMTGNFHAFQNQQGVRWLLSKVWPQVRQACPSARLLLVGHMPTDLRCSLEAHPGVQCTGTVPTVAPYLHQASVAAVPLLHGSGMRIKILEALACGLPVVSTALGAEGIALTNGTDVLLADTPTAFARCIVDLLRSTDQCQQLARNGLALLRREYSMTTNTERLKRIVMGLVAESL
ncbi:MAG: glycosyltransferase [Chloroflexi bacterium]|nr:glycosyltransferase [Chloroflexota bacterium]